MLSRHGGQRHPGPRPGISEILKRVQDDAALHIRLKSSRKAHVLIDRYGVGVVVGGVAPLAEDAVLGGGGADGHLSALRDGLRGGSAGLAAVDALEAVGAHEAVHEAHIALGQHDAVEVKPLRG